MTADILPPVIVLVLQLGAGLMIGASPLVLGAAAAAIVLAAYVVQVTRRRRTPAASASPVASSERLRRASVEISPSSVATFEGGPLRASVPSPEPVTPEAPAMARVQRLDGAPPSQAPSPRPSAETPSIDGQPEHHPDLEWLWGTILPDPSARPQRRNDR